MTATMRGAPSTPLKTRVADKRASRLLAWICFALLRLLTLNCVEAVDETILGDERGTRPKGQSMKRAGINVLIQV